MTQQTLRKQNLDCLFPQQRSIKVLLVEDCHLIQLIHKNMLTSLSCFVDVAKNGKEAMLMAEDIYDLIILDVGLPDIRGPELSRRLRENKKHAHTPMIVVTGFSLEEIKKENWTYDIKGFFNKPLDINLLSQLLNSKNFPLMVGDC